METHNYDGITCQPCISWLRQFAAKVPDDHILEHLRGCARCKGALFVWIHALTGAPQSDISCETCEIDLGAFMETELDDVERAYRWYPGVWQHLWTCESCLEQYDMLRQSLSDPELQLTSPAWRTESPIVSVSVTRWHLLDLMRDAINAVLGTDGLQPAYRLADDSGMLFELLEPTLCLNGTISCGIDVELQDKSTCRLIVRLDPPCPGSLVLDGARTTISAPLSGGEAVFLVPLEVLQSRDNARFALFLLPDQDSMG